MTWLRRGFWLVAGSLLAGGAVLWVYIRLVLPQTEGTLSLAGLRGEVRVERDRDGIPTIRAQSAEDAIFGLGFVHAQDRLWQLETHRRIGSGRLAEAFGEAALDTDRFLRSLGVRRAAQAQWARAGADVRSPVGAYTAGINAYLSRAMKARPPEFVILGLTPEPWTPEDTLAWALMMCWDLGGNWTTELARMRLSLKLPVERIAELYPPAAGDKALITADYAALYRALKVDPRLGSQALRAAPSSGIEGVGSNNWVVDGRHSQTGRPLLANDPHLKLSAPALWYLARLDAPGLQVAGASMPGLPVIVLGQNRDVAWGYTNTGPDVQDLYLERIRPDDPTHYQTPGGWAAFAAFDETIKVRGKPDVAWTARATRHGPVISGAGAVTDGLTGPAAKPAYAIAMRWTALDADADSISAALAFNRATSVADFVAASARHVAPMQNMVVADRNGSVAMVAAGRVPLRQSANDLIGQVPAPGWDSRYDWAGFLDPAATPREFDPPRGWIATANQRIHAADYPHYIGNEWALPYRQQRIEQLLQVTPEHSVASFRAMQGDVLSLAARALLPLIRRARSPHPLAAAAQERLAAFDATMAADQAAPLIFWAWTRQLTRGIFADEVGLPLWDGALGGRSFRDALEGVIERDDAWWCDDKSTAASESCEQQADAALTRALDELQAANGADITQWQWGRVHVARSEHRPFSSVKPLARWFELRTPTGGDTYTVNVSNVGLRPDRTTGELYLDEHGPSLRAIYDLGDPSQSRIMQSSGQSGIQFSPLYRGFVARWTRVEDVPLWDADADRTLVLRPG